MFVRGESHAIFKEAHGLVIDYIFVSLSRRCRPPLDSYFSERNMHRRQIEPINRPILFDYINTSLSLAFQKKKLWLLMLGGNTSSWEANKWAERPTAKYTYTHIWRLSFAAETACHNSLKESLIFKGSFMWNELDSWWLTFTVDEEIYVIILPTYTTA